MNADGATEWNADDAKSTNAPTPEVPRRWPTTVVWQKWDCDRKMRHCLGRAAENVKMISLSKLATLLNVLGKTIGRC